MPDHIETLHSLARNYRDAENHYQETRTELHKCVQQLKIDGWSFRELVSESGLAQGTIQKIIAADPRSYQYWRKRCTRKADTNNYCDEIWLKNTDEWCESCLHGKKIEDSLYRRQASQP